MTKSAWLFLFTMVTSQLCDAFKILVWFPIPGKSHDILGTSVAKHLLQAGHEVTFLTAFPTKKSTPRFHEIDITGLYDEDKFQGLNITALLEKQASMDYRNMVNLVGDMVELTSRHPNVVKLLSDTNQKFDVVIAEWLYTDTYAALGAVYDCPLIWLVTVDPHFLALRLIDEYPSPAFVPDVLSSNVPPFTFIERLEELLLRLRWMALQYIYFNNWEERMYQTLYGPYITQRGKPIPPFDEVKYNVSLILGNSHVSLGLATRLPQAYKPIGGYHIDTEVEPLPENLKKLLDNANTGLIYFSMGSNLRSKDIPDTIKKGLLKMFSGLKQTILWKFEVKMPNLPSNVHIVNWAPQRSILAHPNCILFITHGGMLSTTETIHFGKPIVGIPVFADQFNNIDRAVKRGFALKVDLSYTMVEELKEAVQVVLSNPRFTNKAKELSFIYHHRPVSPGAELVHWVEHVVKTRGAPHLRSPALHVPFYQKMYLDLAAVFLATFYILRKAIIGFSRKQLMAKKNKID